MIQSLADLIDMLWPVPARLLDIGSGQGDLVRTLRSKGHQAFGCEPQADHVAVANRLGPDGAFEVASAENLPYPDNAFDGALMVHALHHVPHELMGQALDEALRCVRPNGVLAVIEPVAEGSFFEVLKLIDDETVVRARAQMAISDALAAGRLRRRAHYAWERAELYRDGEAIVRKLVANDPSRQILARDRQELLMARLAEVGQQTAGGWKLLHRITADIVTLTEQPL